MKATKRRQVPWRVILVSLATTVILARCGRGLDTGTASTLPPCPSASAWHGTKELGVSGKDTTAYGVAIDTSCNVYIAGNTNGALDGITLTGVDDAFVTQYNSSGVKQWTRLLGVAGKDTAAYGVATDASGNVYIAGYTDGGLDGNTLTGNNDFFVTQYNSAGAKQWTRQLGVAASDTFANGVAVDASGNIYVAGTTSGGLGGNTLTGTNDFFVARYNSAGTKQWIRQLGASGKNTDGRGVAIDGSGNIYVGGYTLGGLDGNTLTGTQDFFVTQYNSAGTKQWTRQMGVAGKVTEGRQVAADTSGNVYVAGYTLGGLDGNSLTGTQDFFVTQYNSAGTKQWTRQLGVSGQSTSGQGAATDASGHIYVAGHTSGSLDGTTSTGGSQTAFLAQYNSLGTKQWVQQLGSTGKQVYGYGGAAADALGNVYISGYTLGGIDGNPLIGTTDSYVTQYNALGTKQ